MGALASLQTRTSWPFVALSLIKLEKLVQDLGKAGRDRAKKRIISTYQKSSAARLLTLGDLRRRMLDPKASVPDEEVGRTNQAAEALRAARGRRMSRQELRDAARLQIGDTSLLDFVLKSLGGCVVCAHLVHRSLNPARRVPPRGRRVARKSDMERDVNTVLPRG